MVSRKSSIPFPTSPPPLPPPDFGPPQSSHEIDASDLPPVPDWRSGGTRESPDMDTTNPWQEDTYFTAPAAGVARSPGTHAHGSVQPNLLASQTDVQGKTEQHQLPNVLKAGWSGQVTPRSSLDSDRSKDFWDSSDDEDHPKGRQSQKPTTQPTRDDGDVNRPIEVPASLQVRRKPVSPRSVQSHPAPDADRDFSSNNPFRQQSLNNAESHHDQTSHVHDSKGKGKDIDAAYLPPIPRLSGMDLGVTNSARSSQQDHQSELEASPWDRPSEAYLHPPHTQPPPVPGHAPPTAPAPDPPSPFSKQAPLIAVNSEDNATDSWSAPNKVPSPQPSPLPQQKAIYTDDLLDRGSKSGLAGGSLSLGDELKALPNHAPGASAQTPSSTSVDDVGSSDPSRKPLEATEPETYFAPPVGPPPSQRTAHIRTDGTAPVKPPRPAVVTKPPTEAEMEEMKNQRNETYQIKHFRWFDHRMRTLRSSSMLTQNKNGPCPLLALVNALILGAKDQDQAVLDEFLRTREQVTLGTIIENLVMELLSATADGQLPDVDELNRFLLKLRTGMNMNPRFVIPPPPAPNLMDARNSILHLPQESKPQHRPGTFEASEDLRLYSAFGVQTVHGWLAEPESDAAGAFQRSAQNYEDAQAKLFGEDELEFKLSRNGLTPEEQVVWEDIISMKHFFQSNPTQLTQFGLNSISSSMQPGSFTVLFRNDHFSTIYKNPQDGKLYSLITDAGYADRDEVIWESLVDISGQHAEFFSGDFKSVSHSAHPAAEGTSRSQVSQPLAVDNDLDAQAPQSPNQRQEQEDADFAMAMMLQQEEEQQQREREQRNRSNSTANPSSAQTPTGRRPPGSTSNHARSGTNTSQNASIPEIRPLVPPRNTRASIPAVNRSSEIRDPDAPPAYEEAARGKAYHPPLGSPLHPTSSTSLSGNSTPFASSSNVNLHEGSSGVNAPGRLQRRSSAYAENADRMSPRASSSAGFNPGPSPAYDFHDGAMPGSYLHTGRGGHGQSAQFSNTGAGQRQRDRDRDCVVM